MGPVIFGNEIKVVYICRIQCSFYGINSGVGNRAGGQALDSVGVVWVVKFQMFGEDGFHFVFKPVDCRRVALELHPDFHSVMKDS